MRVLEGPPRPLIELAPRAPSELVAICEKAMERDIARRYRDMPTLAEDLRAYLERRVVKAYESGTWAETKKWVQRNKSLAASAAAAMVLLVASIMVLARSRAQSEASQKEIRLSQAELEKRNSALDLEFTRLVDTCRMSLKLLRDTPDAGADIYVVLARAYSRRGRLKDACQTLQKAPISLAKVRELAGEPEFAELRRSQYGPIIFGDMVNDR